MAAVDICRNCGGSGYTERPSGRTGRCVYCWGKGYVEIDSPETDPQPEPAAGRCGLILLAFVAAGIAPVAMWLV